MIDTHFIKSVAQDYGIELTDEQAVKADQAVRDNLGGLSEDEVNENYYYALKQYFLN